MFLGVGSLVVIVVMTFTIGRYWVEIFDKYQEKKKLEEELAQLEAKEEELRLDASKLQDPDYVARYAREKYLYSKDDIIFFVQDGITSKMGVRAFRRF